MDDVCCLQGEITQGVQNQIVAAVKFATTLTAAEKRELLASLEG
jgi:hypothetical protein